MRERLLRRPEGKFSFFSIAPIIATLLLMSGRLELPEGSATFVNTIQSGRMQEKAKQKGQEVEIPTGATVIANVNNRTFFIREFRERLERRIIGRLTIQWGGKLKINKKSGLIRMQGGEKVELTKENPSAPLGDTGITAFYEG